MPQSKTQRHYEQVGDVMDSHAALGKMLSILAIVSLFFLTGCGSGTSRSLNNQSNQTPTITSLSPSSTVAGDAGFTLTINGTNFVVGSVVSFGSALPATTFVSSTELTAAIPAAAIASSGSLAVTVTNPAPGGGTSAAANFTITSRVNPVPAIYSLSPSCVLQGEQSLTPVSVNGQNFVDNSVVRWNGNGRPTTFVSDRQLTTQLSASDIAAAGTATVTVFNPAPGGGGSNASTFSITTTHGVGPLSIAVDRSGKFAYVANEGCTFGYVSMYMINATTGALTSIGPPVASADDGARSVAVHPSGQFVYVVGGVNGLSAYNIHATTGALTFAAKMRTGGCVPRSVAVDSSGKFLYVANEDSNENLIEECPGPNVSMFTIDGRTGALTPPIRTPVVGGRANFVAVDPAGQFAYVVIKSYPPGSAGNVSMYTINATTGSLTSTGTIPARIDPVSVVVDLAGKFAYVTNSNSNDVSMYTINATTGALAPMGPIAAGSSPNSIAIHPSGKFAYVTNSGSNDVSMYTINATTGALTSIGTIAAGSGPSSIAIDPSGKFAYVTNFGSNNVSMYSIDTTTGALTLIGTVAT